MQMLRQLNALFSEFGIAALESLETQSFPPPPGAASLEGQGGFDGRGPGIVALRLPRAEVSLAG